MDAAKKEQEASLAQTQRQAAEARDASAKTKVDAQIIAQEDTGSIAKQEFLDFMSKTPEERLRALILKQEGMTEEQIAALPPEEREKIEDKIREKIRDEIEKKTGMHKCRFSTNNIICGLQNLLDTAVRHLKNTH